MRHRLLLLAALLGPATPAFAQVTVDLRALDALPHETAPAPRRPEHRPSARGRAVTPAPRAAELPLPPAAQPSEAAGSNAPSAAGGGAPPATGTTAPSTATATPPGVAASPPRVAATPPAAAPPQASAAAAPPPATMSAAPPPVAEIAPVAPPPPSASAAPPPPPVEANAGTKAAPTNTGLRLTFPTAQTDLSPASVAAIKQMVAATATRTATFNVVAYATGTPGDASAARRLSLSRALAVRSALMADGVDSSHIYLRALGSQATDGPADRVDITLLGSNAATASSP